MTQFPDVAVEHAKRYIRHSHCEKGHIVDYANRMFGDVTERKIFMGTNCSERAEKFVFEQKIRLALQAMNRPTPCELDLIDSYVNGLLGIEYTHDPVDVVSRYDSLNQWKFQMQLTAKS